MKALFSLDSKIVVYIGIGSTQSGPIIQYLFDSRLWIVSGSNVSCVLQLSTFRWARISIETFRVDRMGENLVDTFN